MTRLRLDADGALERTLLYVQAEYSGSDRDAMTTKVHALRVALQAFLTFKDLLDIDA